MPADYGTTLCSDTTAMLPTTRDLLLRRLQSHGSPHPGLLAFEVSEAFATAFAHAFVAEKLPGNRVLQCEIRFRPGRIEFDLTLKASWIARAVQSMQQRVVISDVNFDGVCLQFRVSEPLRIGFVVSLGAMLKLGSQQRQLLDILKSRDRLGRLDLNSCALLLGPGFAASLLAVCRIDELSVTDGLVRLALVAARGT